MHVYWCILFCLRTCVRVYVCTYVSAFGCMFLGLFDNTHFTAAVQKPRRFGRCETSVKKLEKDTSEFVMRRKLKSSCAVRKYAM